MRPCVQLVATDYPLGQRFRTYCHMGEWFISEVHKKINKGSFILDKETKESLGLLAFKIREIFEVLVHAN